MPKPKCTECGAEINHVVNTWTAYNYANVTLTPDGLLDFGETQVSDSDYNKYICPVCHEEIDLGDFYDVDDDTDQAVKDFLSGVSAEEIQRKNIKEQEEKEKEKSQKKETKEQWQRRQMGRSAMDTPNLDYSILSKNAEKKVEPKKEMVQIVRKASLNTKNHPRLPRLIVERKKVVLSEDESC